jgi:hypothetical protein
MSTQAEDAAQNLEQWIRALLTDTLSGVSVESEKVGASTVLVTAVSFADGSSWGGQGGR